MTLKVYGIETTLKILSHGHTQAKADETLGLRFCLILSVCVCGKKGLLF